VSLPITAASNADPAVLTSAAHGLATGDRIAVTGATGLWAPLNGTWPITRVDEDTFSVPVDSTGFDDLTGTVVATTTSALVTIQQIKAWLEITGSEHDVKLQDCADRASEVAQDYCDRKFAVADYDPVSTPDDALLDGKDLPFIYTPQWPIVSVTLLKLVQEGNNGDLQSFAVNQYAVQRDVGKITLLSSAAMALWSSPSGPLQRSFFPDGIQNIAVTYRAGFASLPKGVEEAIVIMAAHMHTIGNTRRLMAASISMSGQGGGGTASFKIDDMPPEARARLDRYKSVIPR
jgi:hypothetical protein